MKTQSSYFQNLSTVVSVLDEACGVLPAAPALIAQGLNAQLVELVEGCRAHSAVQKRVLEREMEVWQLVEEQKRSELFAQNKATGPINSVIEEIDMGEAKGLQRGSVGSDRGG
jgi:indoleamine 2,3-dioxygenase